MLKQKSSEYRGYRTAGIRLSEEQLPQLAQLYGARTKPMLPAIHAFDKAHTVMLVEEGLLERAAGVAILRGLRQAGKRRCRRDARARRRRTALGRAIPDPASRRGRRRPLPPRAKLRRPELGCDQHAAAREAARADARGQPLAAHADRSRAGTHRHDPAGLQLRPARAADDARALVAVVGGEPRARLRAAARRVSASQHEPRRRGDHGRIGLSGESRAHRRAPRASTRSTRTAPTRFSS